MGVNFSDYSLPKLLPSRKVSSPRLGLGAAAFSALLARPARGLGTLAQTRPPWGPAQGRLPPAGRSPTCAFQTSGASGLAEELPARRPQPSARSLRRGAAAAERSAGTSPPFRGSLRPARSRPHAGTDKASGAARHVTLPRCPAHQPGSRVTRARARSPRNSAFTGGPLGLLPGGLVPACPA